MLVVASTVTACGKLDANAWFVSRYKHSADFIFEPDMKPRMSDPPPDLKALVGANLPSVFGHTEVKNVKIGAPRPDGYRWNACIKADVVGIMKKSIGTHYFIVEIDRGVIGLRRDATPADGCESEKYTNI